MVVGEPMRNYKRRSMGLELNTLKVEFLGRDCFPTTVIQHMKVQAKEGTQRQ